jgi:hypothetical protein
VKENGTGLTDTECGSLITFAAVYSRNYATHHIRLRKWQIRREEKKKQKYKTEGETKGRPKLRKKMNNRRKTKRTEGNEK